jgi:hypothetical protein
MSPHSDNTSLQSPPLSPRFSRRSPYDPKRIIPQLKRSETMLGCDCGCGGHIYEQLLERQEACANTQVSQLTTESSEQTVQSQE